MAGVLQGAADESSAAAGFDSARSAYANGAIRGTRCKTNGADKFNHTDSARQSPYFIASDYHLRCAGERHARFHLPEI